MTDKKWSELTETDPTDGDGVALQRGSANFRWTFSRLRTWLNNYFATDAELASHTGAANPHSGSASQTDLTNHTSAGNPHSNSASASDFNAHTSGQSNTHAQLDAHLAITSGDPHGAYALASSDLTNHKTTGAAQHPVATTGVGGEGFAPALSGVATQYLDGTGAWSEPPGGGSSPTTTLGDMIYRGASADTRLPIGTSGQVMKVGSGGIPEWQTDAGGGVNNPPSVKGDLWTFHTADTQRLPVGANGTVLLANSAATAGVEWSANIAKLDAINTFTAPQVIQPASSSAQLFLVGPDESFLEMRDETGATDQQRWRFHCFGARFDLTSPTNTASPALADISVYHHQATTPGVVLNGATAPTGGPLGRGTINAKGLAIDGEAAVVSAQDEGVGTIIRKVVAMTQAEYISITPDSDTLYHIIP